MNYKINEILQSMAVEINKDNVSLDDTLVGCDFGLALNVFPCIDFQNTADGAVWATFNMMKFWSEAKDILFDVTYNLNATDAAKNIRLNFKTWSIDSAELPLVTEDNTYNEAFTSATTNTNKLTVKTCATAKIANADISATAKYLTIKITRDNSVVSNYGGTFQLISVRAYQI